MLDTTDGSTPTLDSTKFNEPVNVGKEAKVLVRAFNKKGRGSLVVEVNKDTKVI